MVSLAIADDFKPYLHNPVIPEHPEIKLYGQYSTKLFTGSASYSHSLVVPKGTGGFSPQVFLSYNNQGATSRPGTLGAGWSFSESYIFRDINGTVNDVSDDRFELVLEGTPYNILNQSGDYRSDVEYYFRVERDETNWTITTKNGVTYNFGTTLDSNQAKGYSVKWFVSTVQDTFGNTIYYDYDVWQEKGVALLKEINYNNGQEHKILFSYEPSPKSRDIYFMGNRQLEQERVKEITILSSNELVRRYGLEYVDLGLATYSLGSLKEYGSDNFSLYYNISFTYNSPSNEYLQSTTDWIPPLPFEDNSSDEGMRFVDINADGFMDILHAKDGQTKKVFINDKKGGWQENATWKIPVTIADATGNDYGVRFADQNMDGFVDIIQAFESNQAVYLNNRSGWKISSHVVPIKIVPMLAHSDGVQFVDINGDGLQDFLKAKSGETTVYLNQKDSWVNDTLNWDIPFLFKDENASSTFTRMVDINGDGLQDAVRGDYFRTIKRVWVNTGSGWKENNSWTMPTYFTDQNGKEETRFVDVNNDGLIDILSDNTGGSKKAWLNDGTNWVEQNDWKAPTLLTASPLRGGTYLADVNGDGLTDFIVSYSGVQSKSHVKNQTDQFMLKSITNEYGGKTEIEYVKSTSFNNTNLGFNIFVVANITGNNSMDGSFANDYVTSYTYSGGVYNYNDSEFRGFGQTVEIKPSKTVIHKFYQDNPRRGKEYETTVLDGTEIFSKQHQEYDSVEHNGIYNVTLRYQSSYLYDGNNVPKVVNTSYVYDPATGNPLEIVEHGDVNITGDERITRYSYAKNTRDWILDRVARVRKFDSQGRKVAESMQYYDDLGLHGIGSRGAVTKKEAWNNHGNNTYVHYIYDSYGNVILQVDSLGNVAQTSYDVSGTYPRQVINSLGHISRFTYDRFGNVVTEEKNGIMTSYEYDLFGRIAKEIKPYDTSLSPTKEYIYSFDGIAPEQIEVESKLTSNKTADITYVYDGFGKVVQLLSDTEDDVIVKNLNYDNEGRVISEQLPYYASNPASFHVNYTYDAADRVVLVENADGSSKQVLFNQWNITDVDENGQKHQYDLDAYGRIVGVREYNGEEYLTTYSYDANDNLIRIRDNEGNTFDFGYDSLGRKISMDDPDLGKWEYKYDSNGNLKWQNGGGGNLISGDGLYREYNKFGRLIRVRNGTTNVTIEEYSYDHNGDRVKIVRSDGTTVYTPFKELMRIVNSSGSFDYKYIYEGDMLVAKESPDGSKHYFHNDHLGSNSVMTDEVGSVIERSFYSPYGEEISGGILEAYGYTGQFDDDVNNQMYYKARYYNPNNALFMQADTLLPNVYDSQQLNRYMYVRGNPYKYTDPSGFFAVQIGVGGQAGAGVGANVEIPPSYAYSYSRDNGFQFGTFGSVGAGTLIGKEAQLAASITIYPWADSIENLEGKNVVGEVSGFGGLGLGVRAVFASENEDEFWDKLYEGELGMVPVGYGLVGGVGGGASGSVSVTGTRVATLFSLFKSSQNNYVNHIYNNPSLDINSKNKLLGSVAKTSNSNKKIRWYHNQKSGQYQYWVGEGAPSNKDYEEI